MRGKLCRFSTDAARGPGVAAASNADANTVAMKLIRMLHETFSRGESSSP